MWAGVSFSSSNRAQAASAAAELVATHSRAQRSAVDATRAYIKTVLADAGIPGLSIALAVDDHVIWEAGFGFSDVAAAQRTTIETLYRAGSIAKLYTATAIMQLVESGDVRLDDPIDRYVAIGIVNPLGEREITVRDLMLHRSGLGQDAGASSWTEGLPLAAQIVREYASPHSELFAGTVPRWQSKVGERWEYSNLGVATLGLIVENANPEHLPFADYVQRHVLAPLRMRYSQVPSSAESGATRSDISARLSTGYARMGAALIPTLPVFFSEVPAASLITRPADHIHLLMAMLDGGTYLGARLLSPWSAAQMTSPAGPTEESGIEQGFIWQVSGHGTALESFGHDGGHVFGWRMYSKAWPRFRSAVVIAVNQWVLPKDADDPVRIEKYIEQWLPLIAPHGGRAHGLDQRAWEVSYVRGALAVAMYKSRAGVSGPLPTDALLNSTVRTRIVTGSQDDWDAQAYLQGVQDMAATGFASNEVRRFWSSTACKVSESTARLIYQKLGGRFETDTLDDVFLAPPNH